MKIIKTVQNKDIFVDNEDYAMLSRWRWSIFKTNGGYYAKRFKTINGRQRTVAMHRQLLGLKFGDSLVVDHIDRNGLNNQKNNLRILSNGANISRQKKKQGCWSKFKGVTFDKRNNKRNKPWIAQGSATKNKKRKNIFLGYYKTEQEAYKAYKKFAIARYGNI